jgi:hypothetical protein
MNAVKVKYLLHTNHSEISKTHHETVLSCSPGVHVDEVPLYMYLQVRWVWPHVGVGVASEAMQQVLQEVEEVDGEQSNCPLPDKVLHLLPVASLPRVGVVMAIPPLLLLLVGVQAPGLWRCHMTVTWDIIYAIPGKWSCDFEPTTISRQLVSNLAGWGSNLIKQLTRLSHDSHVM